MKINQLRQYLLKWDNLNLLLAVYGLVALVFTIVQVLQGAKVFAGQEYTHYNNFLIFKNSFYHLIAGKDLYALYPDLYWDYYKYSPSFALLFAPLAILPDLAGLLVWNSLNALSLYGVIRFFPNISRSDKARWLWIILPELIICLQNAQSNGLIAAMMIAATLAWERRKGWLAALMIIGCGFIKLFGFAAIILFVLYPGRRKFIAATMLWSIVFFLLPLLVITPGTLDFQYKSWIYLLIQDRGITPGLSVDGILKHWFAISLPGSYLLGGGLLILMAPLLQRQKWPELRFRLLMVASLLIWVVIFNHKAESPTFIIAMAGVALWYLAGERSRVDTILLLVAIILTSFSRTDLFPRFIRNEFFIPIKIKVVPCILIWLKIQWELWLASARK